MKHDSANMQPTGEHSMIWRCLLLGLFCLTTASACLALDFGGDFTHDQTGFPLDFQHATLRCESCHVEAIFAGTPRRCEQCHSNTGLIRASAASSQHIRITGDCDYCHQPNSWLAVPRVDHYAVAGPCQSCHDGVTATGKNPDHVVSSNVCDDCHRTFVFAGAVYDHSNISDSCITCHNGVVTTGKNPTHILSTNFCEDCHNTFNFAPVVRVDHNDVIGSCSSCHNGVTATGKNDGHVITVEDCLNCHSTFAWLPASNP